MEVTRVYNVTKLLNFLLYVHIGILSEHNHYVTLVG